MGTGGRVPGVWILFTCLLAVWPVSVGAGTPFGQTGSTDSSVAQPEQARAALRQTLKGANDSRQFAEVIRRGNELLRSLENSGSASTRADVLALLGEAWYKLGDHEKALEHLIRGLAFAEVAEDRTIELLIMSYIGFVHRDQKNWDQAIEVFTRAAGLARKHGVPNVLSASLNELGMIRFTLGQHQEALALKHEALAIARDARIEEAVAYTLNDLGELLSKLGRHLEALEHFGQAEALLGRLGRARELSVVQMNRAAGLIVLGNPEEAAELARRVVEKARAAGYRDLLWESLETLARAEAVRGVHHEAYEALQEAHQLRGELFEEGGARRIAELQVRFDLERKERQIRELESTNAIAALRLSRERLLRYVAVSGLLLLGVLVFLIHNRYRLSLRARRALEAAHDEIHAKNRELHDANDRLARAALHDALTGLLNRRGLMERIELERVRSLRSQKPFSIVLGDLDFFKSINDRHGHQAGDAVLEGVGRLMDGTVRKQDAAARWGGEEFMILLPETAASGALVVAEKLRHRIEEHVFEAKGARIPVTMTFGVAEWDSSLSVDACTKRADEALYAGKHAGRNRVVLAGVTPDAPDGGEVSHG